MSGEKRGRTRIRWVLQGALMPALIVFLLYGSLLIWLYVDNSYSPSLDLFEKALKFMKDLFWAIVVAGGLYFISFFDDPKNAKLNFRFLGFLIFLIPFVLAMRN